MNIFKALCVSARLPGDKRGIDYYQGNGCEVDYHRAFSLFLKESEDGDPESQYMLGSMLQTGIGCLKNHRKAFEWYEKSAEQGHPKAQFKLGMMCKRGDAYVMDKTKALDMMQKSAAQGNADAQNMLGIMLKNGVACEPDTRKAAIMFRRSAEQGHAGSRTMLSTMHTSQDYEVVEGVHTTKPYKKAPKDLFSSGSTEIYKPDYVERINKPRSNSIDRILVKDQSATVEQVVNAVSSFNIHQFEQILSAGVHLLVKKSSMFETQGELELASAYKQVALNVGANSLSGEGKRELQRTISSAFLLNKVALNNTIQQRVTEMNEKMEQKEEIEKHKSELFRRGEEMDARERNLQEREQRIKEAVGTIGRDKRIEEITEKLAQAEEKCKRWEQKEKEWERRLEQLHAQLEDIFYHNFLEDVNRLIPKSRQVKCLIWYGCKDEKESTRVRSKLSKIKGDLNKAGMDVVIEGHKDYAEDEQSKVVICTQQLASNQEETERHYSLEKRSKVPPNFISLILDSEPSKSSSNEISLNTLDHRKYCEKMISLKGLVPALLEVQHNETYLTMLEAYREKLRPLHNNLKF